MKNLSWIAFGMLSSLNSVIKRRERQIDITEDGIIDEEESEGFLIFKKNLNTYLLL